LKDKIEILSNIIVQDDEANKEKQKAEAAKILREMSESISVDKLRDLTQAHSVMHEIKVTNETPIRQKERKIPYNKQQELREMLQEMLEAGIISKSNSSWRSPIRIVGKSDGTIRLTIDFSQTQRSDY